jgi:pSer/pThr/pTyr-binding forkhead associated (FHA) protein
MSEIVLVEVNDDGTQGVVHTLQGRVTKVGKLPGSNLKLDHPSVGRMHATLEFEPGGKVNVIDLGSVQGTYVNDQKINKAAIEVGDLLRFGDVVLSVQEIKDDTAPDEETDQHGLSDLAARIDQLKRVREMQAAQKGNGEPKKASTRFGELIGAAIIGNMLNSDDELSQLDAIIAMINGVCDSIEQLRTSVPADRVAKELDGLIEVFMPALQVVTKRMEQLSDYTEASIERGVLFRAGLVKKLKDDFELSEDDAMEIVRSMSDEMKEQIQKITK